MQEIEFMKRGSFSPEELDALVSVLQLAGQNKNLEQRPRGQTSQMPSTGKSVSTLQAMGVKVYGLSEPNLGDAKAEISWDNIAGYSQQKRYVPSKCLYHIRYNYLCRYLVYVHVYVSLCRTFSFLT